MNEVTFPEIVTASAAAAILGINAGSYPAETEAYVIEQPSPTASHLTDVIIDPSIRRFSDDIAAVYASLSKGQEPLGADFEAVWDANVEKLYEF